MTNGCLRGRTYLHDLVHSLLHLPSGGGEGGVIAGTNCTMNRGEGGYKSASFLERCLPVGGRGPPTNRHTVFGLHSNELSPHGLAEHMPATTQGSRSTWSSVRLSRGAYLGGSLGSR